MNVTEADHMASEAGATHYLDFHVDLYDSRGAGRQTLFSRHYFRQGYVKSTTSSMLTWFPGCDSFRLSVVETPPVLQYVELGMWIAVPGGHFDEFEYPRLWKDNPRYDEIELHEISMLTKEAIPADMGCAPPPLGAPASVVRHPDDDGTPF